MAITAHPFNQGFGAELKELDLSQPLTQDGFDAWSAALAQHPVLVLRDQFFTDRQHVDISRWFGALEEFPDPKDWAADDLPQILRVSNVDRRTDTIKDVDEPGHKSFTLGTGDWHIDSSYLKKISRASLLYAREVPPSGGDTMFANMAAAYEALPETKKREIDGLMVVHDFNYTRVRHGLPPRPPEVQAKTPPVKHPIAHRLPSGERSLLLGSHVHTIEGMDFDRAQALLAELTDWVTQPRFTYRHKWKVGDLVMWDNTRTMHRAMPFELSDMRRVLQRTTVVGIEPVA